MRRYIFLISTLLLLVTSISATQRVNVESLYQNWEQYKGQRVKITTPLYLCGIYYDSLVLADERLYVPEELATGLADGDSTIYHDLVRYNQNKRICLKSAARSYELRTGAMIRGLEARVVEPGVLETGSAPHFTHTKGCKRVPNLGQTDLVICSANIQNFFYDLGGYASRKTTRAQYELQRLKTATALVKMKADIYALCELEKGEKAPEQLVEKMNQIARKNVYCYVPTGTTNGDTISVGFIYRKDRVEPYGPLRFAYHGAGNIYGYRFQLQGWRCLSNEEVFYISLNHLRSKRGTSEESSKKRMANVDSIMNCLHELEEDSMFYDPDILLLGDYNSYTQELPIQAFVRAGYTDMLPLGGYSYVYDAEMGYLDRVFASQSMQAYVTSVQPVHWNADTHYTHGFKSKYNYKNRVIPTESPEDIRRCITPKARRNLVFRYADHDPILIGIRFTK